MALQRRVSLWEKWMMVPILTPVETEVKWVHWPLVGVVDALAEGGVTEVSSGAAFGPVWAVVAVPAMSALLLRSLVLTMLQLRWRPASHAHRSCPGASLVDVAVFASGQWKSATHGRSLWWVRILPSSLT